MVSHLKFDINLHSSSEITFCSGFWDVTKVHQAFQLYRFDDAANRLVFVTNSWSLDVNLDCIYNSATMSELRYNRLKCSDLKTGWHKFLYITRFIGYTLLDQ